MKLVFKKTFIVLVVLFSVLMMNGCGIVDAMVENTWSFAGLTETGTVISRRAQIRSSYAVVAADLLEVKRGQTVEVLSETIFEKVLWYRVRAFDEVSTEGWIESQHLIKGGLLKKSNQLAEQSKELQSQAQGQLRAASNLRLEPKQTKDNILLKLDNGSSFEIIDWEWVPKPKTEKQEPENEDIKAAKEGEEDKPEEMDDKYDTWYKVRLDPSVSPAPMGWIFGRQVQLLVPSDISFFQRNTRKFVTWQRLDDNPGSTTEKIAGTDSEIKVSKPGSWVILSRTNESKAVDGVEPDFDGILVLGFDKYTQSYYTAFGTVREKIDVWGMLPLKVEGVGDNKTFTVKLRNQESGEMEEKQFVLFKDKNKRLRVTPPEGLKKVSKDKKK